MTDPPEEIGGPDAKEAAAGDSGKEVAAADPCFSPCILAVTKTCTPEGGCMRAPNAAKTEEATCFENGVKAYTVIASKGSGASYVTTFRAAGATSDCYATTYVVDGGSTLEMRNAAGAVFATGKSSGTGMMVSCGGSSSFVDMTNPACPRRIYGGVFGGCLPDDKKECAYP